MKTITQQQKKPAYQMKTEPTLQVKRSLMPLDEYAAREGVSTNIVHRCGRLGILQIRKCKGQTYVVDVPFSPYVTTSRCTTKKTQHPDESDQPKMLSELVKEISSDEHTMPLNTEQPRSTPEKAESKNIELRIIEDKPSMKDGRTDKAGENISEQIQTVESKTPKPSEKPPQLQNNSYQHDDIFEMLNLDPPEPVGITDEPAADENFEIEDISEPIRIHDLEAPEKFEDAVKLIDEAEEKQRPETIQPYPEADIQFETFASSTEAKSNRPLQLTIVLLAISLAISLFANLWFFKEHQLQQSRLDQAYISIQSVYDDFIQQKQTSRTMQSRLNFSEAKVTHLQNELSKSTAQVKNLTQLLEGNSVKLQESPQE